MTQPELVAAFKKLPPKERLEVVEAVLHTLHEEFPDKENDNTKRLSDAAAALLEDYNHDDELTSFTALDGEDFREQR